MGMEVGTSATFQVNISKIMPAMGHEVWKPLWAMYKLLVCLRQMPSKYKLNLKLHVPYSCKLKEETVMNVFNKLVPHSEKRGKSDPVPTLLNY